MPKSKATTLLKVQSSLKINHPFSKFFNLGLVCPECT